MGFANASRRLANLPRVMRALLIGLASVAFGFVGVEWLGVSDLGPEHWRNGPVSLFGYALVGALLSVVVVLVLYFGIYIVMGIAGGIVGVATWVGDLLKDNGSRGVAGLALQTLAVAAASAPAVVTIASTEAGPDYWTGSLLYFGVSTFAGVVVVLGVGLVVTVIWMVVYDSDPFSDVGVPSLRRRGFVVVLGVVAFWVFGYPQLIRTYFGGAIPSKLATTLATANLVVAFALVLPIARQACRRRGLASKSDRTPVWASRLADVPGEPESVAWSNDPVSGYRFWAWDSAEGQLLGAHEPWPSASMTARCTAPQRCERPPGWNCNCGIYILNDPNDLHLDESWRQVIWGRVSASGRVVEHDNGYRAHEVTIERLWVLEGNSGHGFNTIREALNRRYGSIPIGRINYDDVRWGSSSYDRAPFLTEVDSDQDR